MKLSRYIPEIIKRSTIFLNSNLLNLNMKSQIKNNTPLGRWGQTLHKDKKKEKLVLLFTDYANIDNSK